MEVMESAMKEATQVLQDIQMHPSFLSLVSNNQCNKEIENEPVIALWKEAHELEN